ncbi:pantothenate synthetase [Coprinopsis cinerea okayama7|uniref:Pantoate--beta-alanine ligase n=1 Tax=Coprinopsis cinerea (strain Okayama-7 / 130 / ATCC MYA-4618 / FGSC 9003) TaxID=240176 RepID=A8N8U6_COPC7|nr:pantothenate synthetase [Coprinopsis cinerea okayama7\|eukprot:XP_001831274.2 pantothenate synthetase [Coprinopsis cinerea okayama7\
MTAYLPQSTIPIFTTVASYREWRQKAFKEGKSVGFVPTMGALHEGHLSLVRRSLTDNDLTVVSIFVNPAQFAPHEDLATYPRTLPTDLKLLEATTTSSDKEIKTPSAVFAPTVKEMYPSGIVLNVSEQKGTFIEVKGYSHQMEGMTRPTFFRGVATVVTKLFNIIQPTHAYFGQKDIQQAFILKRLVRDLLCPHPTPENLHIVPTARDPTDGLALSSRNAYLSPSGRKVADTLRRALLAAEAKWKEGNSTKQECIDAAVAQITQAQERIAKGGLDVQMKLDYIEMNDADDFSVLPSDARPVDRLVILSGALYVDKTRLIDNILLGDTAGLIDA